ncbi:MAG: hypothetical protein LBL25_01375, partial [Oscillospiraceae bacterium]|nr:hypothetical protein [Oscillospiraceae bacterium]
MSTSKIKNIVIAVLVFINVFFLSAVLVSRVGEASGRRRVIDDLRTVLENAGVALEDGAIASLESLRPMSTERDAYGEAYLARAVLGDCSPSQDGGANSVYTGERGTAEFNARGEFRIELTEPYAARGGARAEAKRLLREMGLDASDPALSVNGDTETASAVCEYKGAPTFNCVVSFEFEGGLLLRVTGRRPSGVKEAPPGTLRELPTALLEFLAFVRGGGIDCSRILSVEAGYRLTVSAFGDGTLSPGWLVTTDAGGFFINSPTGEIVADDA